MLINKENLGALNTAIEVTWKTRFKDGVDSELWRKIADPINSKTNTERIAWLGNVAGLREWKSERVPGTLSSYGYDISAKKWESTLDVDRADLEDDNTGNIQRAVGAMANKASKHYTRLITAAFDQGFTTNIFDGQYFFDNDHTTGSNYLGTSKDLNGTNVDAAELLLAGQTDDRGDFMGLQGTHLIVGPALKSAALNFVKAGTVNIGGVPVDNPYAGRYEVIVLPQLGMSSKKWALADLSQGELPFVMQIRIPITGPVAKTDLNSDRAFDTDIFRWGTRARHNAGYGNHQLIVGAIAS